MKTLKQRRAPFVKQKKFKVARHFVDAWQNIDNAFRYVGNNPLGATDPTGEQLKKKGEDAGVDLGLKGATAFGALDDKNFKPTANWDDMFETWLLEKTGTLGGTWKKNAGEDQVVLGPKSPYTLDVANSPSMSSMDGSLNGNSIRKQFFEKLGPARYSRAAASGHEDILWAFTGPGSVSGKYTVVEWFLGSYRASVEWRRVALGAYSIRIVVDNKSGWFSATRLPSSWQAKIAATLHAPFLPNVINDHERGSATPSVILKDIADHAGPQAEAAAEEAMRKAVGAGAVSAVKTAAHDAEAVAGGISGVFHIMNPLAGAVLDWGEDKAAKAAPAVVDKPASWAGQPSLGGNLYEKFILPDVIWNDPNVGDAACGA